MGTEFFFFFMVELARFLVDSLFVKVAMEMNQVLIEQGDLLSKYVEQFFKAHDFLEFFLFMDCLQLTAVYCNRRGV